MDLVPCNSSPFLVIRYQLKVDHGLTEMPTEWYKDQGGMNKHMTLCVKLKDTEDKIVKPRSGIIHLILRFVPITSTVRLSEFMFPGFVSVYLLMAHSMPAIPLWCAFVLYGRLSYREKNGSTTPVTDQSLLNQVNYP